MLKDTDISKAWGFFELKTKFSKTKYVPALAYQISTF